MKNKKQAKLRAFTKEEEEIKRDKAWKRKPAERWLAIQAMITWAEANMRPEFRRNRPRRPHQR